MSYHINPTTGRPNKCRAKIKCPFGDLQKDHYSTKEAAQRAYEERMKEKEISTTLKKITLSEEEKTEMLRKNAISRINSNGGVAARAGDIPMKFYHDSKKLPPPVGKVRSVEEADLAKTYLLSKPVGVLWLSPGVTTSSGRVATDWRHWGLGEEYVDPDSNLHEVRLDHNAVVMELNEENLPKARVFAGLDNHPYEGEELSLVNGYRLFADGSFRVPWRELKESGVDAVRINGRSNRGYFYGYDCDSLVILNGDCVKEFQEVEGVKTYGAAEEYYNHPITQSYMEDAAQKTKEALEQ